MLKVSSFELKLLALIFGCFTEVLAISDAHKVTVVLSLQQLLFRNLQYLIENNFVLFIKY